MQILHSNRKVKSIRATSGFPFGLGIKVGFGLLDAKLYRRKNIVRLDLVRTSTRHQSLGRRYLEARAIDNMGGKGAAALVGIAKGLSGQGEVAIFEIVFDDGLELTVEEDQPTLIKALKKAGKVQKLSAFLSGDKERKADRKS